MDEVRFEERWSHSSYVITAFLGPYRLQLAISAYEMAHMGGRECDEYIKHTKEIMERRLRSCVHGFSDYAVDITGVANPYTEFRPVRNLNTTLGWSYDHTWAGYKNSDWWSEVAQQYGFEKPRDEEYEAFCQWDQEEPDAS